MKTIKNWPKYRIQLTVSWLIKINDEHIELSEKLK